MTRILLILTLMLTPIVHAAGSINVLIYHHVASGTPASTSVTVSQFENHLNQLAADDFNIIDLGWAIDQIQKGQELPEKAVAITFDDGFIDIYNNAFPILKGRNIPFTLFVATDAIDQKQKGMMTWDMLREMKSQGATIANHTTDHDYLVRKDMLDETWLEATWQNITDAQNRLESELGNSPKWLAYPYGEYNNMLKKKLKNNNWLAFGQQSGGIAIFSDYQALPRFPAAGIYANWNNLRVKMRSKPLPVDYENLADPVITTNPPILTANLLVDLPRKSEFACFIDGERQLPTWSDTLSFSIKANAELPRGRSRYNCTLPDSSGFYFWFSHQWLNDSVNNS